MAAEKASKSGIRSVWMISREYDGLAGAGGVKDVCRQLAESLAAGRCPVRVVLPRYGFMDAPALGFAPLELMGACPEKEPAGLDNNTFAVDMDYADMVRREKVSIWQAVRKKVTIYLVESERFAEKMGVYTYTAAEEELHAWQRSGAGHLDYFAMNILLQKAALGLMCILGERPDVIHCQDGHAAVLPALIRELEGYRHFFRCTGAVVTVHNAGIGYHQDVADLPFARAVTGLPDRVVQGSLLGGAFDPFIAASGYAVMNTVSEQYARELQETAEDARTGWLGHHLLRRGVRLAGITNGINPRDFNAARGKQFGLAAGFDPGRGRLNGKRVCKETLLRSLGGRKKWSRVIQLGRLAMHPDQPLLTFIGRLTSQKGVDLLIDTMEQLLVDDKNFQLLVLGSGGREFEERLAALTGGKEFSGRVCFLKGYDQDLALQVYAAGDFLLIPSQYEPCGLTDYIAQLLGSLPIVHAVGGLVKVIDGQTGFTYADHTVEAMIEAVRRALSLYRKDPDRIKAMQVQAVQRIREHHTWDRVKDRYLALYEEAVQMACYPEPQRWEE
ncbi:MAG: glycogen/starch synthase [Desulfobulbaceae bacterium]|jgi:starch synthase|nr:glycogen/starch synthase [Desulfobulbaceae bacterium]